MLDTVSQVRDAGFICEPDDAPRESWESDVYWRQANLRHGHVSTMRTTGGLRQISDAMGLMSRRDMIQQIFYGDCYRQTDRITGFAPRYATMNPMLAQNAVNVFDGKGRDESALTSMWLIGWGPHSAYLVTPDGQPPLSSGLGEIGLAIADWRYISRIANVDAHAPKDHLHALLARALVCLPCQPSRDLTKWRFTIYVTPHIRAILNDNDEAYCWFRGVFVRAIGLSANEQRVA
jgi:hypothetical protein